MSLQQTHLLSGVVKRLVDDFPSVCADSKNTQTLVKTVLSRLNKSLSDDIFIPLYPKNVLENRQSEASVFFHRQFWATIKFLTGVVAWDGVLSPKHLKALALDSVLNRYLVIAVASSPVNVELVHKCSVIASALPRDWFFGCSASDQTLPQLENFCRTLVSCAKQLRAVAGTGANSAQENRELVRQICKILVTIHATNHAIALSDR